LLSSLRGKLRLPLGEVGVDLRVRLQRAGLSQDDLARHLGKSKAFISQLLHGKKHWPAGMRKRAEAFIAANDRFAGP
jgi:transcriptional regulator with XRE-family HTH domain